MKKKDWKDELGKQKEIKNKPYVCPSCKTKLTEYYCPGCDR